MSKSKTLEYVLTGGRHAEQVDGEQVILTKGDTIKTDSDLIKRFPNKFELAPGQKVAGETSGKSVDTSSQGASDTDARGEDVTAQFEGAEDNGLSVFKLKKKFYVYDDEAGEVLGNGDGVKKADAKEVVESIANEE